MDPTWCRAILPDLFPPDPSPWPSSCDLSIPLPRSAAAAATQTVVGEVSAGIDGSTTGTLAAPSDLNCPYIILIGPLGWRERGSGGSKIMRIMRRASEMAGWEETEDLMGMPWWRHTHMHIL